MIARKHFYLIIFLVNFSSLFSLDGSQGWGSKVVNDIKKSPVAYAGVACLGYNCIKNYNNFIGASLVGAGFLYHGLVFK